MAKNATCNDEKDDPIANNTRLHGEGCNEDYHCIHHEDGATCNKNGTETLGTCVAARKLDEKCDKNEHSECPAQSYCSSDKKCVKAQKVGNECDTKRLCEFGLICIASDEGLKNHTCHKPGSLQHNVTFKSDDVQATADPYFGIASVCFQHTYNETKDSKINICRKGDISDDTTIQDLRRETLTEKCNFTTFVGDIPDIDAGSNSSEAPQCGFNKNSDSWCRKRKGDQWFTEAFAKFHETDFSGYNCHPQSSASACRDAYELTGKDIFWAFDDVLFEVNEDLGFARIANNDRCVAEAITAQFWRGRDPEAAFGYSVIATMITALLASSLM